MRNVCDSPLRMDFFHYFSHQLEFSRECPLAYFGNMGYCGGQKIGLRDLSFIIGGEGMG